VTLLEQIRVVQKWAGNYEDDFKATIIAALNAEYLRFTKAYPNLVTTKTDSFSTVASQRDQQIKTDAGRLIRAWDNSGENGYNGYGTIEVWDKSRLVAQFPKFHIETGYPRVLSPAGIDDSGYLFCHFDRLPDGEYTIYVEYHLRVTPVTDESASMAVQADEQFTVAIRTARKLVPGDSTAFQQLSAILGLDADEKDSADRDVPETGSEWIRDQVTSDRRDPYYERYARG